jgi:hypothetical protein
MRSDYGGRLPRLPLAPLRFFPARNHVKSENHELTGPHRGGNPASPSFSLFRSQHSLNSCQRRESFIYTPSFIHTARQLKTSSCHVPLRVALASHPPLLR